MMKTDNQESLFEEAKKVFNSFLETRGLRKTPERFAILKSIYMTEGHFDVEMLLSKVEAEKFTVSRATIYNTIELLVECNLVTKHQFGNVMGLYEKSYGFRQHDHLICTECNTIHEFCDPRIQNIQKNAGEHLGFNILHHSLILYGTCVKENCDHKK